MLHYYSSMTMQIARTQKCDLLAHSSLILGVQITEHQYYFRVSIRVKISVTMKKI